MNEPHVVMETEVYPIACTNCWHGRFRLRDVWFESRGPLGGTKAEAQQRMTELVASMYVGEWGEACGEIDAKEST